MASDLGRISSDGKKIAFRNILLQTKQYRLPASYPPQHTHLCTAPSCCWRLYSSCTIIGIHLLKPLLRQSNIRNKTEVAIGQSRTHKRDGKIKHICPLTSVLRIKVLTKNTILLHLRVAISKDVFDNFETHLKISNAYVHRCKMFHLNSASQEFPFCCSFTWPFLICHSPAAILLLLRNCANEIAYLLQ